MKPEVYTLEQLQEKFRREPDFMLSVLRNILHPPKRGRKPKK